MKVPLSWLNDYVDTKDIPIEELARRMTLAGLEVEEINFIGLALPGGERHDYKVTGLPWDPEKLVVAEILEVMPHPDADRLVLCRLNDGTDEYVVLTGAPNLYEYKGKGPLDKSIKVAYAKEGAEIYDGHKEGWELTTLKRTKIRGVESFSMVCSEKELGLSEAHEGIIILADDAPVGSPLADYMGDAVLDVAITPNIARNANILGVAREVAALFDRELKQPDYQFLAEGDPIGGQISIDIKEPELNPRFVVGLIKDIEIKPSPAWVQRRLNLIGQRPINNIVDVTNYVMFDIGQPLHAFDYDELVKRAGGKAPVLITRTAVPGEKITTLDGVEHELEEFTELVCDEAGSHSIAGIMGGLDTEVTDGTVNVLLEGANWNFINIRQSLAYLRMHSEASYRFSRGVHPAMAERGVRRGLEFMREWSGGVVSKGLVDEYPLKAEDPAVEINPEDVRRSLGIELSAKQIAGILDKLAFKTSIKGDVVTAVTPDHRLDISADPVIGRADLMEEIARIYGYDNIPEARMADVLPPQRPNRRLEFEERLRDILVSLGLQEIITYSLTTPDREAKVLPPDVAPDPKPYVELVNPISVDRNVMRKSLLSSVLEVMERNTNLRHRLAVFEIGRVFMQSENGPLPDELPRLVIAMAGSRQLPDWLGADLEEMDFFDLKGVTDALLEGLHLEGFEYLSHQAPFCHPAKCASIKVDGRQVAVLGELHPIVQEQHDLGDAPVQIARFDLDVLQEVVPLRRDIQPVSPYPPVLEDLALVVDESVPAARVAFLIAQTGGKAVADVRLFDVFRGEQIGKGKKSLAYSLTYQADDRTLTDKEVAKLRHKIVRRLEHEVKAELRS